MGGDSYRRHSCLDLTHIRSTRLQPLLQMWRLWNATVHRYRLKGRGSPPNHRPAPQAPPVQGGPPGRVLGPLTFFHESFRSAARGGASSLLVRACTSSSPLKWAPGSAVSVVSPEPELTREYPDLTVTTDAAIPRLAIDLQLCVAAVIDVPAPPARRRRKVAQ